MKKRNEFYGKNDIETEILFREVYGKKDEEEKCGRAQAERAERDICEIIGKPKYIEFLKTCRYTFEESVRFIKEKYKAEQIGFAECLDYIPDKYGLIGLCRRADAPVLRLTGGYIGDEELESVLLLPALGEQNSRFVTRKNGCVLLLTKKSDFLGNWWIGGNRNGYEALYRRELCVLGGGKKKF